VLVQGSSRPSEDAAAGVAVPASAVSNTVYPSDLPLTVWTFLGAAGLFFAVFTAWFLFHYWQTPRDHPFQTVQVLTFIAASASAFAYFALWSGAGVSHHPSQADASFVFWARYLDRIVSTPLIALNLGIILNAPTATNVFFVGGNVFIHAATLTGAFVVSEHIKYAFWAAAVALYFFVSLRLYALLAESEGKESNQILSRLVNCFVLCTFVYLLSWVLGVEGTHSISMRSEVALVAAADVIGNALFGAYLLNSRDVLAPPTE